MKKVCSIVFLVALCFLSFSQKSLHVKPDVTSGTGSGNFIALEDAVQQAMPGDTIVVHEGVYRQLIDPPRGGLPGKQIVYQAAPGEKAIIKGSEIVKGWQRIDKSIWRLTLVDNFFENYNPYTDLIFGDWYFPMRRKLHTGEVYVNELPLYEVDSLAEVLRGQPTRPAFGAIGIDPSLLKYTWCCEHRGDSTIIYANFHEFDPNREMVEINVRPACFYPSRTGINYITVQGFHLSQAATQWAAPTAEQIGLIGTNWSRGWIIEDNVISDSKCVGLTLGKDRASGHNVWFQNTQIDGAIHYNDMIKRVIAGGWTKETIGSHIVRRNTIYRCGAAGICGSFGAAFSIVTDNHIYDIHTYRPYWGAEMAGIKFHGAIDALVANNRVHNAKMGIWLDWMTQGTRVSGNLLYDNDLVDFYPEVNHGPYLVDNNLFLSGMSLRDWSEGGAYVYNLFGGIIGVTPQSRSTPYFEPNSTKLVNIESIDGGDNRFVNNIFIGSGGQDYIMPPQVASGWDEMDSVKGRGTGMYDRISKHMQASGNAYWYGAYPLQNEKQPFIDFQFRPTLKVVEKGNEVFLEMNVPKTFNRSSVSVIFTEVLGKTIKSKQSFTDGAGKYFFINTDYLQHTRPRNTLPGPFASIPVGATQWKVWPKQ